MENSTKQVQGRLKLFLGFKLSILIIIYSTNKDITLMNAHFFHGSLIFPGTSPQYTFTPIEIVSKVLLRHSNLSTTQRYLGKISDAEAIRWIDNLHG